MFKHLILASLIAFSLQVDNCITQKKYCKRCNTDFYVLIEYENYKQKVSKCIKKADYELIKAIDENCIDADSPYQTCKECKRGYHTANSGKKCIQLDHCQTENNEKCETCYPPFAKKESEGKCEKKPLCEIIGNDNKCTDCIYYYYPKDGECKSIPIEDCVVGDENTCTQCNTAVSYLNSENKCSKIPAHCSYFKQDEKKCQTCEDHYYAKEDGSGCESITLPNCIRATKADTCTACDEGYYINAENKCSQIPSHCENFNKGTKKCTKCENHYYLKEENNCASITIPNCLQASNENTCTSCEPKYYIAENKCAQITVPNCLYASKADACSVCEDGYYVTADYKCSQIPSHCETFNKGTRKCDKCENHYYLKEENNCVSITIPNCLQASDENTCIACEQKYYVSEKKCASITIPNCLYASSADACLVCEEGYYVNTENKCSQVPSHCKTFSNRKCQKCDDDYYLKEENNCQPNSIANCQIQTSENVCATCKIGYGKSDNGDQCNQMCLEEQDVCTKCDSNYDSFNYGESCEVLDSSKIPPKSDAFSSFININLVLVSLLLSFIL